MKKTIALLAAIVACVEWTRLSGTVKIVNLRSETVTIQNKDGDLLSIPVDYQVRITAKDGELRELKRLALNEKITLTRTLMEKPPEDTAGMSQPEPSPRGDK